MKVAFITRGASPRTGGIQSHLDRIAKTLARNGHSITVFASRIDDVPFNRVNTLPFAQHFEPFTIEGVTTKPIPLTLPTRARLSALLLQAVPGADRVVGYHKMRERALPVITRALSPRLAEAFDGAEIVHAMGGEAQAHAARAAAGMIGVPFVITPFAHPGHWGNDELNLRLYRDADAVVALLNGERDWLRENEVASERIVVIGVPAPEPHPSPRLPLDAALAGSGLVLCLGVKRRYKYRLLLDALPFVKKDDVRFAFVGPESPEWHADFAAATKADGRAITRPKVDEPEKWGWLRACDLLCLPSVSEIMPVSILEAWQIGRPVVVAGGRWTADLVTDGQDGRIVAPEPDALAQAITEVLADRERARAMGEAGRRKVSEQYAAAAVSAAHQRLYESLVGAKG
jgi:glycosyltransferase involved in cell wall biosynthesis